MPGKSLSGICDYELSEKFMRLTILLKQAMLTAALSGFVIFAALLLGLTPKDSKEDSPILIQDSPVLLMENAAAFLNQKQISVGSQVRLKIPVIGVDSSVISVGLTPEGAMETPKKPDEVAWFNLGSRPGENGSAVMAGHYGWKNNVPAVFDNLHKLNVGDKIFVEDENGTIVTFIVREMRTYGKDEAAMDVFGSSDGKGHLNLVTCTGDWNSAEKTFSQRLVVFADKE